MESFLLFLLLCHEVWPLFRKWGRERVFVCSKARDLYCIQYLSFLQLPLAAVLPVPVVISSISDLGADPKPQIYGKIFPSLSSSLHIYLFKCHLAERSGAEALVPVSAEGLLNSPSFTRLKENMG